jgi:hypothetical protein
MKTSFTCTYRQVIRQTSLSNISTQEMGEENTTLFRVHAVEQAGEPIVEFSSKEKLISFWHDLPLFALDADKRPTGFLHFVCEM